MNKLLLSLLGMVTCFLNAQTYEGKVGINTDNPTENLHVEGTLRLGNLPITNTESAIYTINDDTDLNGTVSSSRDQTFTQDQVLVVDKNGVVGKATIPGISSTGPTKSISGIILAIYDSNASGTLDTSYLIGGASGSSYTVGSGTGQVSLTSRVGALVSITGTGYKVSQVSTGLFDIKFDTPFTTIYSLNANLYDTGKGSTPDTTTPQAVLSTLDQLQISYIGEDIIRIRTGNSAGNAATRSFTFNVTGE